MVRDSGHQAGHNARLVDGGLGILVCIVVDRVNVYIVRPVVGIMAGQLGWEEVIGSAGEHHIHTRAQGKRGFQSGSQPPLIVDDIESLGAANVFEVSVKIAVPGSGKKHRASEREELDRVENIETFVQTVAVLVGVPLALLLMNTLRARSGSPALTRLYPSPSLNWNGNPSAKLATVPVAVSPTPP